MGLFEYNSEFSMAFNILANLLVAGGILTIGVVVYAIANRIHDWWVIGR